MYGEELTTLINRTVSAVKSQLESICLGIVHKYNPITKRADIRYKHKIFFSDAEQEPLEKDWSHEQEGLLRNVPVLQPGGGHWWIDFPIFDESCGPPDVLLVLFLKYSIEGLIHDREQHLTTLGHVANFSEGNAVAIPLKLLTEIDGRAKRHHSWKEAQEKPSTQHRHNLRIYHENYHQEIVLTEHTTDGRIILNIDPAAPKPKIDLVEDAPWHVLFAEPCADKYNAHQHLASVGPGLDGPPSPQYHWFSRSEWSVTVRCGNADEHPSTIHPECKHD